MTEKKALIHLEFLPNPGEEDEGLGHAGIETYRRDPFPGAAREIGQNSRDASMDLPVRILNATNASIHEGRIRVDVKANVRTHIEVEFVDDYRGPLDVHMSLVPDSLQEGAV